MNPDFGDMTDYVLSLNGVFPTLKGVIQNRRNDIRTDIILGNRFVIKSFKGMYLPNRIAYSLFRKSKAQRSFEMSLLLGSIYFKVPEPVGYIDYYRFGILQESYFISVYQPHDDLQSCMALDSPSQRMSNVLASFAFQLHQAGVYHDDFSTGNILVVRDSDRFPFALVDLNRVRFRQPDYRAGLISLSRLGIAQNHFENLLVTYSKLWGQSFQDANNFIQTIRRKRSRSRAIRRILKLLLVDPGWMFRRSGYDNSGSD